MAPEAVATFPLVVILCLIYKRYRIGLVAFFGSILLFFSVPLFSSLTSFQQMNVLPIFYKNWFRLGIMLPLVLALAVILMVSMINALQSTTQQVFESIHSMLDLRGKVTVEQAALLTSQKVAERALRKEMMGKTIGALAHDLNNSLSTVLGWAELLQDDPPPTADELLEASHSFHKSAQIASRMVSELVGETSEKSEKKPAIDLYEEIVSYKTLSESSSKVHLQLTQGCHVAIDKVDFQRVFMNLLTNAHHATKSKGSVTVRCQRLPESGMVMLQVIDDGEGMPRETLDQILEAFFTTKTSGQGTGLGLYTVSSIVDSSGGSLSIESTLGEGTQVTILWASKEKTKLEDSPQPKLAKTLRPLGTVLLAEDNEAVRTVLSKGLKRNGLSAMSAKDGGEALSLLDQREDWVALCTDAVMPGLQVSELILSFLRRTNNKPVLIITGSLTNELEELSRHPRVLVVQKPVAPSRLAELVLQEHARLNPYLNWNTEDCDCEPPLPSHSLN